MVFKLIVLLHLRKSLLILAFLLCTETECHLYSWPLLKYPVSLFSKAVYLLKSYSKLKALKIQMVICYKFCHMPNIYVQTQSSSLGLGKIYTSKIIVSVCLYVCLSGYVFRHALRYRAESWHGGKGWAHKVCGHIFEVTSPGVKGHPGVNLP